MLQLKDIKKDYLAGENTVHALKGISLDFRDSEFVSILGPSGCGKTTMLNIIGGLDQYTEGDLVINGVSTKDYRDRDWDTYRNHSVGFVFQTYNLIPHQTVLQNVEIALTLSGVGPAERRERAIKALEEVGLGNQLKKRPNEMSGGQMQRVAIARALVNNPEIILADEPTGALDTETSVQVMDILKKISADRLVVMVTHNPDLANKYSTRIIRMLDGVITDDSKPLTEEEKKELHEAEEKRAEADREKKKPSMSFRTSFGLSLKNLFTKKGRTILTSFAGSIGIIGIALIFSVSKGTTTFIDEVQEETLSSYPLTIQATTVDVTTLIETFTGAAENTAKHEKDAVYSQSVIYEMLNALYNLESTENDLKSFKKFIEDERADEDSPLHDALSGVKYTYNYEFMVYTKNTDGRIIKSDANELVTELVMEYFGMDMSSNSTFANQSSMMSSSPMSSMMAPGGTTTLWVEMLEGNNGELINPIVENQYDVIYGRWPSAYNEIVLVVDERNEVSDSTLYALGLVPEEEIRNSFNAVMAQQPYDYKLHKYTYEEICSMDFRVILNSDCYKLDEETGLYTDMRQTDAGLKYLYDNAVKLKVTGIIRPDEDAVASMLNGNIAYTGALTRYIIEHSKESDAVEAQLADPSFDVIRGLPFKDIGEVLSTEQKAEKFRSVTQNYTDEQKADLLVSILGTPGEEEIQAAIDQTMSSMSRDQILDNMIASMTMQTGMSEDQIRAYIGSMSDEEIDEMLRQMIGEQVKYDMITRVQEEMASMSEQELASKFDQTVSAMDDAQIEKIYDNVLEFSASTYEANLMTLGCVDLDDPASVNLYAASFADKDTIIDEITAYNDSVDELKKISYTDYVGLIMSSVTTIINAITYVLIAFVAISLIVSSIMIGVITLISVQERTKEIGILRAIGASKKDVSGMFNAETMIIGFVSGLIGVVVTYILCIPINIIVHKLTNINNLSAYLPISAAITLIVISVLLTLIAGIIPSRSAAKKDPVVALRTE